MARERDPESDLGRATSKERSRDRPTQTRTTEPTLPGLTLGRLDPALGRVSNAVASHVDPDLPGPVLLLDATWGLAELHRKGIDSARWVIVNPQMRNKLILRFYPNARIVEDGSANLSQVLNSPAAAAIWQAPFPLPPIQSRLDLLASVFAVLRPGAPFIVVAVGTRKVFPLEDLTPERAQSFDLPRLLRHRTRWSIPGARAHLLVYRARDLGSKEIEVEGQERVRSKQEHPASEGFIHDTEAPSKLSSKFGSQTKAGLPETPSRLWPGRSRGRPSPQSNELLLAFLRETYGDLMPAHRDELRSYIHRKDPKLYRAIADYERNNSLPDDLRMPTQNDLVMARLRRAARSGFKGMTKSERRSVTGKLSRADQPKR